MLCRTHSLTGLPRLRFAPFADLDQLFRGGMGSTPPALTPMDLSESENEFTVELEVPGRRMKEHESTYHEDLLSVRGKREQTEEKEGVRVHLRERRALEVERAVRLPAEIDIEKVEAVLQDGVLTVRMPKSPQIQPKQIEIKRG